MLTWAAAALLTGFSAAAQQGRDWTWRETTSPHFAVMHEMPWAPPGFVMNLERMHSRLRMDLGMFSPWMAKERLKLYLYKDSRSYLAGEFEPPTWSNGLALYQLKAVAVPDNPDRKSLMRVIRHETTHLLFEGFWREAGKEAPSWLNEGLAMMEEDEDPDRPERSLWFQNMVLAKTSSFMPLTRFFSMNPAKDMHDKTLVADWYVQAYSMVYFLYRQHQRLQFKSLCSELRDGKSVEQGLWLTYRYRDLPALQKAWLRWRGQADLRNKVEQAQNEAVSASAEEESKPKDKFAPSGSKFSAMKGFKSLRE
ncbi:MAG: hypothetical protein HY926_03420 [Elusimicrobia bacterium]|nr:hypothetical protein [Elusimicrobiota bacterium]